MSYPFNDRSLTCSDCGQQFVFTAGEQEFHQSRGFTSEPRRCASCRAERRGATGGGPRGGGGGGGGFGGDREMFTATCASCGREARVPFRPTGDRPVYCGDCFRNQPQSSRPAPRGGGGGGGGGGRRW